MVESPETDLLTADEVAGELRVTSRSVRRWAAEGEFPGASFFHGMWRFPRTAPQDYLSGHCHDGADAPQETPNPTTAAADAAASTEPV